MNDSDNVTISEQLNCQMKNKHMQNISPFTVLTSLICLTVLTLEREPTVIFHCTFSREAAVNTLLPWILKETETEQTNYF